jgi:hypothetical protein
MNTQHHQPRTGGAFRIFTWLIGLAVLIGVIVVVAQQFGEVEQRETPTIEGLVGQWKNAGLKVGSLEPLTDTVGAKRAAAVDVNGTRVHVYHFNVDDPKQLEALEEIRSTKLANEDGKQVPAIANGSFVMTHAQGHHDEDAIVHEFSGYGTFEGIKKEVEIDETKP